MSWCQSSYRVSWAALAALLLATHCKDKPVEPLSSLAPRPLPSFAATERTGALPDAGGADPHRVEPFELWGDPADPGGERLGLFGTKVRLGGNEFNLDEGGDLERLAQKVSGRPAVLRVGSEEVYLAQVTPLLAVLDDGKGSVFLEALNGSVRFQVRLRDEASFQTWLDEAKPGKIRVIQRADGLELQTNIGKLPGGDPNGPTLPIRGGALDIAALRRAIGKLKERFPLASDVCLVPSFGTELVRLVPVLSGFYTGPSERAFDEICLVYPRPRSKASVSRDAN